jgi:transcriptional antiterminator RfaH
MNVPDEHSTAPAWFCLRTHSRHEHIAGGWLGRQLGIETYAPRIRFRRLQPRGLVWFTEALFPNYLFARFELANCLHKVETAPGIREVVRFGAHYPRIPDQVIQDLRSAFGAKQVRVLDHELRPGETVQLAGSPFHGLQAVVTRVMPQRQRVTVLMDFLGRQTMVELASASVARVEDERLSLFPKAQAS